MMGKCCAKAWRSVLFAWLLLGTGVAAMAADPPEQAIAELSEQLFKPAYCDAGGRQTMGIWTFERDRIPISVGVADRIYAAALNALLIRKPACVDVLDGTAIGEIAEHLKRTGAFREAGENPLLALERANRKVAVLLRGNITAQDGAVFLAFRAVDRERGVVLAQTRPWPLPEDYVRSAAEDTALSLDVALQRAANQLAAKASGLRVLIPLGVYYQDSGAQPPLARYLLAGLLAALENETANLVTGAKLRVIAPELKLAAKSGAMTSIDDFDPLAQAPGKLGEGTYALTGRYWQVGDAIDLKLTLRSAAGDSVSWQGRVRLSDLPGLAATPVGTAVGNAGESAFLLQMTSPRGPAPYYQAGEALSVFLRSEEDAWLSCFYIDVNGMTMQVLPNSFQAGQPDGNRIAANRLQVLPDPRRDPFEFRFTVNTLGEETLRCFATTGNPAADLPAPLRGQAFTPLPDDLARGLGDVFHSLPRMRVAEAALTVTIGTDAPSAAFQETRQ
ncbi:MAG: DUF4384 domain-containing protein [Alphaproteobacteria bacterium]|nr:DUF4384 domain-containing protein [Alphaproteobacteria bacterium]